MTTQMDPRMMDYIDSIDAVIPDVEKMRDLAAAYGRKYPRERLWATQIVDTYVAELEAQEEDDD